MRRLSGLVGTSRDNFFRWCDSDAKIWGHLSDVIIPKEAVDGFLIGSGPEEDAKEDVVCSSILRSALHSYVEWGPLFPKAASVVRVNECPAAERCGRRLSGPGV